MDHANAWYESDAPSHIESLLEWERTRQRRQLILIPSESMCIPPAAAMVGSAFGHLYAEGYPEPILDHVPRFSATDAARFASWQRRLSDHRYYKGCVNVDMLELLAQRYAAEAWSRLEGSPPADRIFVNCQPLSGAAANNAVYEALLEPGDTILGMKLSHGGHLTHGSEFNISGRRYHAVGYGVDETTRKLDYVKLVLLAREHRPKLIIGGTSAYPWDLEWNRLREVADEVDAYLLADVAHLAGPILGEGLNNPLPYADVVTYTTHKALCGPRGAMIVSRDEAIAQAVDAAVFPGLQGGPHMDSIAGIARLFELIVQQREAFGAFQQAILNNTATLAQELIHRGFALEYGGTNTHMVLIDLRAFPTPGEPDVPVDGEIASRLLELAGIVVNKNTLPGDEAAGESSGIRMGMPWATQRGIRREHIETLADVVHLVLRGVHTTRVWVPGNVRRCRGRIDPAILRRARAMTDALLEAMDGTPAQAPTTAALNVEPSQEAVLLVRGDKVRAGLQQVMTCHLADLGEKDPPRLGLLLDGQARVIDKACVFCLPSEGREQRFGLVVKASGAPRVVEWLEALSDGYALIDPDDLQAKVDGPMVVEDVTTTDLGLLLSDAARGILDRLPECADKELSVAELGLDPEASVIDPRKTYFIGQNALMEQAERDPALSWLLENTDAPKRDYAYHPPEPGIRKTALNDLHRELGARMVAFADWEMPVHYRDGIFAEHRAVRTTAGLFDVSHMGVFEIAGRHATAFLETVLAGCVSRLDPGMAGYNYLLYPDGTAMDDVYLYRMAWDRYLLVVNGANAERDWDWLTAVNRRDVVIEPALPGGPLKQVDGSVELRNVREAGADSLVDLALQGPKSLDVLCRLAGDNDREALRQLSMNACTTVRLHGVRAIAARTGYTGELVGFELFVHPDHAVKVFQDLLDAGQADGLKACGLGARDSTRTEAGFPLFGHELEGAHGGTLTECGYGFVPRFHVPFFIGRAAYMRRVTPQRRKMLRLAGQGRKSLRPGHILLNAAHEPVGVVTSFAFVSEAYDFVVLAHVDAAFEVTTGQRVLGLRAGAHDGGRPDSAKLVELTALTRFPSVEERRSWARRYAPEA